MRITKERRMRIALLILSLFEFGFAFENFTNIKVILSSIFVFGNIISVSFFQQYSFAQFILIGYFGKELVLYGPVLTWPVLYLLKLVRTQNFMILIFLVLQITFTALDFLWIQEQKQKSVIIIQGLIILFLQSVQAYINEKPYKKSQALLINQFKNNCIIQQYDTNFKIVFHNSSNPVLSSRLQTDNTFLVSPRQDNINLFNDDKEIIYKLYINNEQFQSIEQIQQQKVIFKSTKELLQFIPQNNYYFILATYTDQLINQKYFYQVKYQTLNNQHFLTFIKLDSGIFSWQNYKLLKYKQNLVNTFNHKLKTPLNSAIGHLTTAKEDQQIMENIKKMYLQPALLNCQLQLYLIQDILDFLSCEIEQLTIQNNKINLQTLLFEVYDLIELQCQMKNIELNFKINSLNFKQIENKNLYIFTDSNKLIRVLLNILNNSYRHTNEGGCIILEIKLDQINKTTYFTITDNGQGMNEEQIVKLNNQLKQFDHFTQNKLIKQQENNAPTKLGLNLANRLIKILSGDNSFLQIRIQQNNSLAFTFSISDIQELQSASSLGKSKHNSFVKQKSLNKFNKFQSQTSPRISKFHQYSQRQIDMKNYNFNSLRLIPQSEIQNEPAPQIPTRIIVHQNKQKFHLQRQRGKTIRKKSNIEQFRSRATSFRSHNYDQLLSGIEIQQQQQQQQQKVSKDDCILIVDDEPFNHETLCMMFKNMGYKNFLKAFNGQQCIDVVKNEHHRISMIMMDIDMPIMNGIIATQQIESLISSNFISYIPIIGCTAHEDYESHLQCFEAGMIHVVVKPVFVKSIQEALSRISELRSNETIREDTSSYQLERVQSQSSCSQ